MVVQLALMGFEYPGPEPTWQDLVRDISEEYGVALCRDFARYLCTGVWPPYTQPSPYTQPPEA